MRTSPFMEVIQLALFVQLASTLHIASGSSSISSQGGGGSTYECDMAVAGECFAQLFDQMPICSASSGESAELAFRCVHYNVLDACFARPTARGTRIRCAAKQIGAAARQAYTARVDHCLYAKKEGREKQSSSSESGEQQQQQHSSRRHSHQHHAHRRQQQQQGRDDVIHRTPFGASIGLVAPPTELQFISLFGYLQIQCRKDALKRASIGGDHGKNSRRSQLVSRSEHGGGGAAGTYIPGQGNCSAGELDEIVGLCEAEIRKRQPPPHFELERHRLLRIKLDASSKLLQFPETRPEDECLMVRSTLSDIFLVHQKYCFHATVTKCMCERLHLERLCGIQCSNLEPYGLPLARELEWSDFRGRLSAAARSHLGTTALLIPLGVAFFAMWRI